MNKRISRTAIDTCLYDIEAHIMRKHGTQAAAHDMQSLYWYVNTGRASVDFLGLLINAKPFIIARILHKSSTEAEAIENLKRYLGAPSCC